MELYRALGSLAEPPAPEHRRLARALGLPEPPGADAHAAVVEFQRVPYASVYLGSEGMMGGEVRDRTTGFRRALGLDVGNIPDAGTPGRRPARNSAVPDSSRRAVAESDHVASLLSLLASLESWRRAESDAARRRLLQQARDTLAWEYVLSWMPLYLASFAGCGTPFYERWARLTARTLDSLADDAEFPDRLPEALRTAPALSSLADAGASDVISAALAPVRCGAIVLRSDLARLAEETGTALRHADRRTALRGLLAQDPATTLEWLAGHVRRWERLAGASRPRRIAAWWAARAADTAGALEAAAAEVAPAGLA